MYVLLGLLMVFGYDIWYGTPKRNQVGGSAQVNHTLDRLTVAIEAPLCF